MTTHDVLGDELDRLFADPARNDWPDVVARAARPRITLSPVRIALALVVALLIVVPALGATGKLRALWSHPAPGVAMSAVARDGSGARVAGLSLRLPFTALTSDRQGQLHPHRWLPLGTAQGRGSLDRYRLRWRLSLARGAASSAAFVYRPQAGHPGRIVVTLCSPCSNGDSGSVTLSRANASLLVNGRLALSVDTGRATVTGVVRVTR